MSKLESETVRVLDVLATLRKSRENAFEDYLQKQFTRDEN
jgi:hypothetical protein